MNIYTGVATKELIARLGVGLTKRKVLFRMRERSWDSDRMHSVTHSLHANQQALLNRSYDFDRQPLPPTPFAAPGLDRSWEAERIRGMEMLQR